VRNAFTRDTASAMARQNEEILQYLIEALFLDEALRGVVARRTHLR
jgi:hypothetical protein